MNSINQRDVSVVSPDTGIQPFSRSVSWAVSLVLVVLGVLFAVGGYLIAQFADVERITSWVAAGRITSTDMTDAELIDSVFALIWGGGVAVAITGGLLVLAGVAFLIVQSRARNRFAATGVAPRSALSNAILGSVVTLAVWFVPLAPVLGGAVTGYLHRGSEGSVRRASAVAGVFATLPVVVTFVAITWSLVGSGSGVTPLVVVVLAFSLVVSVAYVVGLSALGGQLSSSFGDDRVDTN